MGGKVKQFRSHEWVCHLPSQTDLIIDLNGAQGCFGLYKGGSVPPLLSKNQRKKWLYVCSSCSASVLSVTILDLLTCNPQR